MKAILTIALFLVIAPTTFAAQNAELAQIETQIHTMQAQVAHIQMTRMAQVLGVSTNNLFQVTSAGQIIAQSYVPVTAQLAGTWCIDMISDTSFNKTSIECKFEGVSIYKK